MHEKITVTVDEAHVDRLDSVAEELKTAGMDVDQVLGSVGIITGSVAAEHRAALSGLSGVTAVESDQTFQIPPPDAEVQ